MANPTVWVVVLGDFGRSPRMQYHAWSLADAGYDVRVLASPGSPPIQPLLDAPNVHLHYLPAPPSWVAALPTLLSLLAKAALQAALMLWAALAALPRPAAILMQNPPAIPVMAVLWLAALRHRAALVIDWHNLAYSILALKHGRRRWIVALARSYERLLGRCAAAHFTVTKAMRAFLRREFGVEAAVLYDRPPEMFKALSPGEKRAALSRLAPQLRAAAVGGGAVDGGGGGSKGAASATQQEAGDLVSCLGAGGAGGDAARLPAIVVSSTSWTPDEDFGILLDAAVAYDAAAAAAAEAAKAAAAAAPAAGVGASSSSAAAPSPAAGSFPDVLFVITGRGPQREEYLGKISRLQLRHCAFASVWLEPGDYPVLLGCADLGVCLHTSSSGLDLPMKVGGAGKDRCALGLGGRDTHIGGCRWLQERPAVSQETTLQCGRGL
jgi:beta-1,4-mannosyltransferase